MRMSIAGDIVLFEHGLDEAFSARRAITPVTASPVHGAASMNVGG